jgi:hypothetical protein
MDERYAAHLAVVLAGLREHGLLLMADQRLPSVATLVAGAPVRGSWWGHPSGHAIYAVATRLEALPEVASAKLVSGKDTWIHRRLWPALVGVGAARQPWQLDDRSTLARQLLVVITREGAARVGEIDELRHFGGRALGQAARELERALLVYGESVHTAAGAHAKRLRTWERWAEDAGIVEERRSAAEGQRQLEDALARLNERFGAHGRLPWPATQ